MIAQGFDKIANVRDPRYLEYINTLKIFKSLSALVETQGEGGTRNE